VKREGESGPLLFTFHVACRFLICDVIDMRYRFLLAAVCALLAACGDTVEVTGLPALEPLVVHADAEWVRDRQQRVVLLRGANYSGLEFGNFIGAPHGPQESDFAQMASWGFNVIRLPIAWNYIEPAPNQFTDRYLIEQVDAVIEFAARNGMLVIPEMHQFQWSACFTNGNGAPPWVCDGHNYPDDRDGQLRAGCDFFQGTRAADGRTLMDHFVDLWSFVARHYAGDQRVAGFDFFNEPIAYTCYTVGPFERHVLNPLYRRLRAAVQAQGAEQTFFFCPSITRNVSLPTLIEPMGPNVVYAPHLYTQAGGDPGLKYNGDAGTIAADYALGVAEARKLGGPLFAAEFGGNTNTDGGFRAATEQFLRDSLAEQDRRLVGGAVWAYFPSDNTFSVVDADGAEKGDLVNILARPYARRIAGIPTAMRFDEESKEFTFSFRDDSEQHPADPTEIFVPATRHYPAGFRVQVSAGDQWEFDAARQRLLLFRGPSPVHTVHIIPSGW
jgi:endoglycosylceramidase